MAFLVTYRVPVMFLESPLVACCLAARREAQRYAGAASRLAFLVRSEAPIATVSAARLSYRSSNAPNAQAVGRVPSKPQTDAEGGMQPARRGVGGGPLHPESADPFQPQPRRRTDLKLGPYAGGRFFVSPKEDPKEFILCVIIVSIFLYTLITTYTQPGGETVNQRRRRIIKERLLKEAGLTQADLDDLEAEEVPLSS